MFKTDEELRKCYVLKYVFCITASTVTILSTEGDDHDYDVE